jgi:endoglucanase
MRRIRSFLLISLSVFMLISCGTTVLPGQISSPQPEATATSIAQRPDSGQFNYAEALQKSLYFYEAQQSGMLSPRNRVAWRGNAHIDDGKDVGRDLSGGWYDAGDHWKSNTTMAYAASLLAWSMVDYPTAYTSTEQSDEMLESLKHVNDYFLKSIVDPNPTSPDDFGRYELYVDIGGNPGPNPGLHSVWCAPEVTNGYTVREALKVTAEVPGPDVAAAMAAAMASSAIAFYQQGDAPQKTYAEDLYRKAVKLNAFAERYPFNGKSLIDDKPQAIAPNGQIRPIDYRSGDARDEILFANTWLHRAAQTLKVRGYDGKYLNQARQLISKIESEEPLYEFFGWWRDLFIGQYQHGVLMLLLQTTDNDADVKTWEPLLEEHLKKWDELTPSQFGLKVRPDYGGNFSLKWTLNQGFLAMMYSDWVPDSAKGDRYFNFAKSQLDYALGDNKQGKSFVVGFGDRDWFNTPHHRGAHGTWAGFEHFMQERPEYLPEARHTLYGALMAGPDANDEFTPNIQDHYHNEVALDFNAGMQGILAGLIARSPSAYQPIPDRDFPPAPTRNSINDPIKTDLEYFVVAKDLEQSPNQLAMEAFLYNKSRWPAQVADNLSFRYYFTLRDGASSSSVTASVDGSQGATVGPVSQEDDSLYFVEVAFPGKAILPNVIGSEAKPDLYRRWTKLTLTSNPPAFVVADRALSSQPDEPLRLLPDMPVFNNSRLVSGTVPR